MTAQAAVMLDAQGLQALGASRDSLANTACEYADVLLGSDAARWLGIIVDPRLPFPAGLRPRRHPVASADEFAAVPADEGPLVYHLLAGPGSAGIRDLVPRWALSSDVVLAVTVYRLPEPLGDGAALLQRADALLVPSAALLVGLARTFGFDKGRSHVIGSPGPGAIESTRAAYDAAVLGRRRRVAGLRRDRGAAHVHSGGLGRDQRLAIVTPLPPERTGVARYSERLIAALAHHIGVDVYREDNEFDNPFETDPVRCFPARGFRWHWELTASVVPPLYCLGNNRYHVHAWRALMSQRGDVLLHDVRLVGLYAALVEAAILTKRQLQERIRLIEGDTPVSREAPDSPPEPELESLLQPEMMMIGEVVDRARRIYVHTEQGREMILNRRPQRAKDVFVVPFAAPPTRHDRQPSKPPIVAAFGFVHNAMVLTDVAGEILAKRPEARVRVVGESIRSGQLERLRGIVDSRGLQGRLEFVGWLDDDQYRRELRQATVAFQLRTYTNGERSASVADCLAAGVPTVVNNCGSFAELPTNVVSRVSKYPRPQEVAAAVTALLDDEHTRKRLSAAALAYARANDAERAAQALVRLIGVSASPSASGDPPL